MMKRIKCLISTVLLMIMCFWVVTEAAAEEAYYSETLECSFMLPEGFRFFYASQDNGLDEERFLGEDASGFSIALTRNALATEELLNIYGTQLMKVLTLQYVEAGMVAEEDIQSEGSFITEDNDRVWAAASFPVMGIHLRLALTAGDPGYLYYITFTGTSADVEETVLKTFACGEEAALHAGENRNEETNDGPTINEETGNAVYSLMNGKMTVEFPPEYTVYIKGENISASAGSDDLEDMLWNMYVATQESDLLAVNKEKNDDEIHIRIEQNAYPEVDDFTALEWDDKEDYAEKIRAKHLLAEEDEYLLYTPYKTSFIGFETDYVHAYRFETIVDGALISIYCKPEDKKLTEDAKDALKQIVDTVRFQ